MVNAWYIFSNEIRVERMVEVVVDALGLRTTRAKVPGNLPHVRTYLSDHVMYVYKAPFT